MKQSMRPFVDFGRQFYFIHMEHYKNLDLKDIQYYCEIDLIDKVEQWKDVIGYEGLYMVSDLGRVKGLIGTFTDKNGKVKKKRNLILKQYKKPNNYLCISFSKNSKAKRHYVHRLVGIMFIDNPENKPQSNHKDLIRTNNVKNNIEWNTSLENLKHSVIYNREVLKNTTESNKNKFRKMLQFSLDDKLIEEHESGILASVKTGICERSIYQVASKSMYRKKYLRKTAGGFKWKYKEDSNV